jgi:hypothetical protein
LHSVKSGTPADRRIENPPFYPRSPAFSDNLQLEHSPDLRGPGILEFS